MEDFESFETDLEGETIGGVELGELRDNDPNFEVQRSTPATTIESVAAPAAPANKRIKKSPVWDEFEIVTMPDGSTKRKCNWCSALYVNAKDGSTSTCLKHLRDCLKRIQNANSQTRLDAHTSSVRGDIIPSLNTWKYDHVKVRAIVAEAVLAHDTPFLHLEDIVWNKVYRTIYPGYRSISRHQVKDDCFSYYHEEKEKMKKYIANVSKIGLTTDCWWSGEQKIGYMAVTAHFIDSKWQLHSRVLAFVHVPPPHSGEVLARELIKVMDEWRILDRVVSISVDNATANDACLRRLKVDFARRGKTLPLEGKIFHVRCCAHILNLLVQDGLKVIQPSVENVRDGAKYLLASEARCIEFNKIVKEMGLKGKRMALDVKTRWNSTWYMLSTVLFYREVWHRYAEVNPVFMQFLHTEEEWKSVENICKFLEVFERVTKVISGRIYPTVNIFLAELYNVKVVLDKGALDNDNPELILAVSEMRIKYEKYWSQANLLISIGAILDPRYKMQFIKWVFGFLYSDPVECKLRIEAVSNDLHKLFSLYQQAHHKPTPPQAHSQTNTPGSSTFFAFIDETEEDSVTQNDLLYYLDQKLEGKLDRGVDFDIMIWWRANALKYPILSIMAKDILSIPITTVASESTFSAGKRVIDPKRSSLKPETVEMLMCGGDWAKEFHGVKKGHGRSILEAEEPIEIEMEYSFGETSEEEN